MLTLVILLEELYQIMKSLTLANNSFRFCQSHNYCGTSLLSGTPIAITSIVLVNLIGISFSISAPSLLVQFSIRQENGNARHLQTTLR